MSRNVKISAVLVGLFALLIAGIIVTANTGDDSEDSRAAATTTQAAPGSTEATPPTTESTPPPTGTTESQKPSQGATAVVAPDPRTLGRPGDGRVTLTEFLDFECPACGAAYPLVEQLRQEYEGRVTFNIRYFPIPGHRNAMPAALAAEAAFRQGKLEPMYAKLFQTQREWAGEERSQASLFRGFAREIGLDMTAYARDVKDPATRKRVERDFDAGEALRIPGTPTFFVNEQPVTPQSADHMRSLLDAALAGQPLPDPGPAPAPDGPGGEPRPLDAIGA